MNKLTASLKSLTPVQRRSGLAAWLGWLFDGLDMHIYTLVAVPFVAELMLRAPQDPEVSRHGAVIQAWMEDHARDRALRKVANDAFGRIVDDLSSMVDAKALGPLGAVAFLAMLERYTYFALSRDLPDDRQALRSVATVIERGFLAPA